MIWLFPLYLLGAGAIIAPILMHLRRRPPQNRVEFSSLMFLDAQTPVPIRNRRLEHWLLLLLRCLALLLLAFMFSRPWFRSAGDAAGAKGEALIVLLDRSGSMRRGDLWQRAVTEARQAVQKVALTDRVAVGTFDHELRPVWSLAEDEAQAAVRSAAVSQRLDALKPGWAGTQLGAAMVEALSWFGGASTNQGHGVRKRIALITDLQEGAKLDALRGIAWPEDVMVQVVRIDAPNTDNFSISLAAASSGANAATAAGDEVRAPGTRVRLSNARDSKVSEFTLAWDKASTETLKGYLPPGASRVLAAPPMTAGEAVSIEATTLRVGGDAWDFDNRVFMAPAPPRKVRIAWLMPGTSRDEASSPLYYLTRALQPTAALEPAIDVVAPSQIEGSQLAFLSGAAPGATEPQRRWLQAGGLGIWVLPPETTAKEIEAMTGIKGITVSEAATDDYRMLGEVKAAHPLLRPFADPRLRDFTKLRFWHHRVVKLGEEAAKQVEVIATFDNGDPAMLVMPQGKGLLLILASGWHPADSQLALSTKFVPLLYGWLDAAGFAHEAAGALAVGDALPLDPKQPATVKSPDGEIIQVAAGQTVRAEMVGVYEITTGGSTRRTEPRAVNLPPDEGRVTPMEPERLKEFGVKLGMGGTGVEGVQAESERERLAVHEEEARQHGWWWVLLALLGVLIWETWLAGRTSRPDRTVEVQA